jgi:hypothetical protein
MAEGMAERSDYNPPPPEVEYAEMQLLRTQSQQLGQQELIENLWVSPALMAVACVLGALAGVLLLIGRLLK